MFVFIHTFLRVRIVYLLYMWEGRNHGRTRTLNRLSCEDIYQVFVRSREKGQVGHPL